MCGGGTKGCERMEGERIRFDLAALPQSKGRIPAADFVGPQYDIVHGSATTDVLIILSTPRSGSTLLCELLRLNEVCLAHEYFQPGQYMPILAERWGCLRGDTLDEASYVANLRQFRTYRNGWLGVNLHGSHLRYFVRMEQHLKDAHFHYVHLVRRNVIAQAVSYDVASQTRQWSSEFAAAASPEYSFEGIAKKLRRVQSQNALILAFMLGRGVEWRTLCYEDLVDSPATILRGLPCLSQEQPARAVPTLRRQAGGLNADWMARFAEEFVEAEAQEYRERRSAAHKRHRYSGVLGAAGRWLARARTPRE